MLLGQTPPAEIQDMADEFAGTFASLGDLRHVPHRDAVGRNGFGGHFGMAQHGADHVVEIMRDTTRERADRLEALCLSKPGLERPALVEHGFAVQRIADDVTLHAQQPHRLPQPGGAWPHVIETEQADHPLPGHQLGAGPGPHACPIERGSQCGWELVLLIGRAECRSRNVGERARMIQEHGGPSGRRRDARLRPDMDIAPFEPDDIGAVGTGLFAEHAEDDVDAGRDVLRLAGDELARRQADDVFEIGAPAERDRAGAQAESNAHQEPGQQQRRDVEPDPEPFRREFLQRLPRADGGPDGLAPALGRGADQSSEPLIEARQDLDQQSTA